MLNLHAMLLAISTIASATIFTCERAGVREFSDRPCIGVAGESLRLPPINLVGIPPLDKSEQAQLDALAREAPPESEAQRASTRLERQRDAEACTTANERLEAIREQRRRGYRLKDEARLNASAESLTRDIRRYCR